MRNLVIIFFAALSAINVNAQTQDNFDLIWGADLNLKNDITTLGGRFGYLDHETNLGSYIAYKRSSLDMQGLKFEANTFAIGLFYNLNKVLLNAGSGVIVSDAEFTILNVTGKAQDASLVFEAGVSCFITETIAVGFNYTNSYAGRIGISINCKID